jgi:hypothetical protein
VFTLRPTFDYQFSAFLPVLAVAAAWALHILFVGSSRRVFWATVGAVALGLWFDGYRPVGYEDQAVAATLDVAGEAPHSAYLAPFRGLFNYDAEAIERMGERIAAAALPGDTLCVRGFEPGLYAATGLRCPSRFPWEHELRVGTNLEDPRVRWLREHQDAEHTFPPTFIVTYQGWADDIARLERAHYEQQAAIDPFVLMRRRPPARVREPL